MWQLTFHVLIMIGMCGLEDSIKNPRFRQESKLSVKDGCKMTRHKTIVQNQFFMKRPWSGDHTQTDTQAIDKRCPISLDLGPKMALFCHLKSWFCYYCLLLSCMRRSMPRWRKHCCQNEGKFQRETKEIRNSKRNSSVTSFNGLHLHSLIHLIKINAKAIENILSSKQNHLEHHLKVNAIIW